MKNLCQGFRVTESRKAGSVSQDFLHSGSTTDLLSRHASPVDHAATKASLSVHPEHDVLIRDDQLGWVIQRVNPRAHGPDGVFTTTLQCVLTEGDSNGCMKFELKPGKYDWLDSQTNEEVKVSIAASPECDANYQQSTPSLLTRQPVKSRLINVQPEDEMLHTLAVQELGIEVAVRESRPNRVNEEISVGALLASLLDTSADRLVRLNAWIGTDEDPMADIKFPNDILMVVRAMQAFLGAIKEVSFNNPPPMVQKTVNELMRWTAVDGPFATWGEIATAQNVVVERRGSDRRVEQVDAF